MTSSVSRILSIVITSLGLALMIAYPMLVYFGTSRLSVRTLGLVLLALFLPSQLLRLKGARREHFKAVIPLIVGVIALLLTAVFIEDHRFILVLPVLINILLLVGFASTLRGPVSLIERFARAQVDDLSPEEVTYCRRVTVIWSIFFACNTLTILALALMAPLAWWTIYSGGLAYVAMGLLFATEFVVRKARFRRYGPGWHDRLFAKIFPPR